MTSAFSAVISFSSTPPYLLRPPREGERGGRSGRGRRRRRRRRPGAHGRGRWRRIGGGEVGRSEHNLVGVSQGAGVGVGRRQKPTALQGLEVGPEPSRVVAVAP